MTASQSALLSNRPAPRLAVRETAFGDWLAQAGPGQRIEYHRGHLGIDRASGVSPFPAPHRRELARIANRVLALAEEGRLLLVQQRHGEGDCSYLAIIARCEQQRGGAGSKRRFISELRR